MITQRLKSTPSDLLFAAKLLRKGQVVGIPTETVYGLAADAQNPDAVKQVFAAKGRPADNPLIVHIAAHSQLEQVAKNIPALADQLAKAFWPGPLTMILPKQNAIPSITSGGLDTVGVRMPAHPVAQQLIQLSGIPLAAPSGNRSGYPSPTTADHMLRDMNGRIAAVVDGGACKVGVESTVIAFDSETCIRILRPGYITREDLNRVADTVIIDPAILQDIQDGQPVRSPGMKYQHYSPKANVTLINSSYTAFVTFVNAKKQNGTYALVFDGEGQALSVPFLTYGNNSRRQAQQLFSKLRELDDNHAEQIYVRAPAQDGVGLAVYNRLIRAAGFEVIQI